MDKKVIISIVAVAIAIIAIVTVALIMTTAPENVEINLQALDTAISQKEPFNKIATTNIDYSVLSQLYAIDPDEYEEAIGKMPMTNVHASMYLVIKAKDGSVNKIKEKVQTYAGVQERTWSTYLPDQYQLVKQRKLGVRGNYVYLVIAESAAEIEELITK